MKFKKVILVTVALILASSVAFGYPLRDPQIAYKNYNDGDVEEDVQDILDKVVVDNTIDASTQQSSVDLWNQVDFSSTGFAVATFANWNGEFGIYSGSEKVKLFDIDGEQNGTPADTYLYKTFIVDGSKVHVGEDLVETDTDMTTFGFYYKSYNTGITAYTQDSSNGGGEARALVYELADGTKVDLNAYGAWDGTEDPFYRTATGNDDWLFAFDAGSDSDFNDAVFFVKDIEPVPEPGTMVLLGFGLIGLAAFGRKKGIFQK